MTENEDTDKEGKKQGKKKKVFSLRLLEEQRILGLEKCWLMLVKCAIVAILILLVMMGHIYGAFAVILIAS